MNPPAKKALGRSIGDTVLAGLALLLVRYFGPEPGKAPNDRNDSPKMKHVIENEAGKTRARLVLDGEHTRREISRVLRLSIALAIMTTVTLIMVSLSTYLQPAPINFNAMPPPIETPVVLFTRSGHWHKAVRDSLGVDRNYETWERINNAIGWMKP